MLQSTNRSNLSPMLVQYLEYKDQYPESYIFFQVGDFYELFFEDAIQVSTILNLTLTSRDKGVDPIPMCGVPINSVEGYLARLVQMGKSVAVVSQLPVPPNGVKGMVPRQLERVITPGVQLLGGESIKHSVVAAVFPESDISCFLATTDLQSGRVILDEGLDFHGDLQNVIERRMASEVIWYDRMNGDPLDRRNTIIRNIEMRIGSRAKFRGESYLLEGDFSAVAGFTHASPTVRRVLRLLFNYLEEVTIDVARLAPRLVYSSVLDGEVGARMIIDATTRTNLELDKNIKTGQKEGSLWGTLDHCSTIMGSRRLRELIIAPLASANGVRKRQLIVATLQRRTSECFQLRRALAVFGDLSRIATRIGLGVVSPRELGNVRDALCVLPEIIEILKACNFEGLLAQKLINDLSVSPELLQAFVEFLVPDPPATVRDGGVVRDEFDSEVARSRSLATGGRSWFDRFAEEQRAITGINSLKVKFNQVLGFFIEVTPNQAVKVPDYYEPRQSTANTRRYVLPELKAAEKEYFQAHATMVAREEKLYTEFVNERRGDIAVLRTVADAIADIDVMLTGAEYGSNKESVCFAEVVDEGDRYNNELIIVDGKHPVLSEILCNEFIPNSVLLGGEHGSMLVVTGPNMGGKSTYLRQVALLVIMAQIGWSVPAKEMRINVVDKVFARLGASDNLLEGESTFMVEMREAGMILSQSTSRSLVVIDEIGRGTSSTDGVVIAQAILESLLEEICCRCLFATHYHQLSDIDHRRMRNVSVQAQYVDGVVVFTHRIVEGAANSSYGLEVARLAGLPESLLKRAENLLITEVQLERSGSLTGKREYDDGLLPYRVYKSEEECVNYQYGQAVKERLSAVDPNLITPVDALLVLYDLKNIK